MATSSRASAEAGTPQPGRARWWWRAVAVWALIALLETLHGIARTLWLLPLVGDLRSRQWGIATALVIVFIVAWFTVRWIGARGARQWLAAGLTWALLMASFDIVMGHWIIGFPWSRIAQDFNPLDGGFLGLGMLAMAAAPVVAARWRGCA